MYKFSIKLCKGVLSEMLFLYIILLEDVKK